MEWFTSPFLCTGAVVLAVAVILVLEIYRRWGATTSADRPTTPKAIKQDTNQRENSVVQRQSTEENGRGLMARGPLEDLAPVSRPVYQETNLVQTRYLTISRGKNAKIQAGSVSITDPQHQNVKDYSLEIIKKDSEVYIKTEAYTLSDKCLQRQGHVTIIGAPGTGKTSLAYQLLRDRKKTYEILIVKDPAEIRQFCNTKMKTAILINDIFGSSSFSPVALQKWKDSFEEIQALLGYGVRSSHKLLLIITCRNYIFFEALQSLHFLCCTIFEANSVVDLSSTGLLTKDEKMKLLESHRSHAGLFMDRDTMKAICDTETPHGFPHSCFLFFKLKQFHKKPVAFFKDSLPFLETSLKDLPPLQFMALLLVLLKRGELNIETLTLEDYHLKSVIKTQSSVTKEEFYKDRHETYNFLIGSFLIKNKDTVFFSHSTVFNTMAYLFGSREPKFVILNCPLDFLFERVRLKAEDGIDEQIPFTIVLHPAHHSALAKRFGEEINECNFPLVCSHQAMSNITFIRECFEEIGLTKNYLPHRLDAVFKESILYWSVWNVSGTLTSYLVDNFNFDDDVKLRAIVCCCSLSGNSKALQCILDATPRTLVVNYKCQYVQREHTLVSGVNHDPVQKESALRGISDSPIKEKHNFSYTRDSLILKACEAGHKDVVELLLKGLFTVDNTNENGDSLLHKSCMSKRAELTQMLIDRRCKKSLQNTSGYTPLHIASLYGNRTHAEILLSSEDKAEKRNMINKKNHWGDTSLLLACKEGHVDLLMLYLHSDGDINLANDQGFTPLMKACVGGHLLVVHELLKHHSNINAVNNDGDTALMLTCREGHGNVIQKLLKEKADTTINNKEGNTPLMEACRFGQYTNALTLLNSGINVNMRNNNGNTSLMFACMADDDNIVELLLTNEADPNVANTYGETPLMIGLKRGHSIIIEMLLSYKASCDVQGEMGELLLTLFHLGDSNIIAKLLKNKGIELENEDATMFASVLNEGIQRDLVTPLVKYFCTESRYDHIRSEKQAVMRQLLLYDMRVDMSESPMSWACRAGHYELCKVLLTFATYDKDLIEMGLMTASKNGKPNIVELFIHHGADVNSVDLSGSTALIMACERGHEAVVQILISHNATICNTNDKKMNAILLACKTGHNRIVNILLPQVSHGDKLDYGACFITACRHGHTSIVRSMLKHQTEVNVTCASGDTPLHVSAKENMEEIVKILLLHKACVSSQNNIGNTPLIEASAEGHSCIVELLVTHAADDDNKTLEIRNNEGDTALHACVSGGFSDVAETLIAYGSEMNSKNNEGNTPLMIACLRGHFEIANLLLSHSPQLNVVNQMGNTAMMLACESKHFSIARKLLQFSVELDTVNKMGNNLQIIACSSDELDFLREILNKITVDHRNKNGLSALMVACKRGNKAMAELLIRHDANVNIQDVNGYTPLMMCCTEGYDACIHMLLGENANVNAKAKDGFTPLLCAASNNHIQVVRTLLSENADVNEHDLSGNDAITWSIINNQEAIFIILVSNAALKATRLDKYLYLACHFGRANIVSWIARNDSQCIQTWNSDGLTPFLLACRKMHLAVCEVLITFGFNLDEPYPDGSTPLTYACKENCPALVDMLLEHEADVNIPEASGDTPLHTACRYGEELLVDKLIMHKANIVAKNNDKLKPKDCTENRGIYKKLQHLEQMNDLLRNACKNGNLQDVNVILTDSHSNVNLSNDEMEPLLFEACRNGHEQIIDVLLSNGANVNLPNSEGNTVLMWACAESRIDIIKKIIMHGAVITTKNTKGESALMVACLGRCQEAVKLLIYNGSDVNECDVLGNTPLINACKVGHIDIVHCLLDNGAKIDTRRCDNLNAALVAQMEHFDEIEDFVAPLTKERINEGQILSACRNGDLKLLKILIRLNVSLCIQNENGETPLLVSVQEGQKDIVKLLLSLHVDINKSNLIGNSPLIFAAKTGSRHLVTWLLKANADDEHQNHAGETAIMVASIYGHHKVVSELLAHRGKKNCNHGVSQERVYDCPWIDLTRKDGKSSLDLARAHGHGKVVKILLQNNASDHSNYERRSQMRFQSVNLHANKSRSVSEIYSETKIHTDDDDVSGEYELHEDYCGVYSDVYSNHEQTKLSSPLTDACRTGNLNAVQKLLNIGAEVNKLDESLPLILAVNGCHIKIMELLLKSHSDVNLKDGGGNTALMIASKQGYANVATLLISHNANVDLSNTKGNTALHFACQESHHNMACILLAHKANTDTVNSNGYTPLMESCRKGDIETIAALLMHVRDIDASNNNGETALFISCKVNNTEAVSMLLESNANSNLTTNTGETPLVMAYKNRNKHMFALLTPSSYLNSTYCDGENVVHLICSNDDNDDFPVIESTAHQNIKNADGDTPLMVSCRSGHVKLTQDILSFGGDINAKNTQGYTALMFASMNGHDDLVKLLFENEANVNSVNAEGETALMLACGYGWLQISQFLLCNGADVSIKNCRGESVLFHACRFGNYDFVKRLLDVSPFETDINGQDPGNVHVRDNNGNTPLMTASAHGRTEFVKLLLESGAAIDDANMQLETSLFQASRRGMFTVIDVLVEGGADLEKMDIRGYTPLMVACKHGHKFVVEALLLQGADVNMHTKDDIQFTPLILSAIYNHKETVRLLLQYGADARETDSGDWCPLMWAYKYDHVEITAILELWLQDNPL